MGEIKTCVFFIVLRTLTKWCSQTGFLSGTEKYRAECVLLILAVPLLTCTSTSTILLCIISSVCLLSNDHGDANARTTPSKTGIYILPLSFAIIYTCSVRPSVSELAQALCDPRIEFQMNIRKISRCRSRSSNANVQGFC